MADTRRTLAVVLYVLLVVITVCVVTYIVLSALGAFAKKKSANNGRSFSEKKHLRQTLKKSAEQLKEDFKELGGGASKKAYKISSDLVAVKYVRQTDSIHREIECLNALKGEDFAPQLIAYDAKKGVLIETFAGQPLASVPREKWPADIEAQLLAIKDRLIVKGVHHYDVQSHNVTLLGDEVMLIDYNLCRIVKKGAAGSRGAIAKLRSRVHPIDQFIARRINPPPKTK